VLEFLYVGRLSPQKGLVHLLNAFKQAFESNKNIHLTIVGNGSEEDMLKSVVCDLEITSNVTFEGYQKDTLPYFKRACATLLTSLFEGFPNVLVESISVGTPVIAFNCPSGPKDIIESGINGILVQYLNVTEFSKAILSVANNQIKFDPDRIIETSKKFSVEKIVKEYEQTIF
jgi:glycosyltransferase involved in cell wall biosynthesis